MTIYAIINGIIDGCGHKETPRPIWSIISPSGILQGGNPYFVPDFADSFEARCALAIKIGRLGKGIARRFACRYVESVAPAVIFIADTLLSSLSDKGLPWTQAISYDRCLALGRFRDIPFDHIHDCQVSLSLRGMQDDAAEDIDRAFSGIDIPAVIESLSRDNTLKTGDIILAGIAERGPKASPGLAARLCLNGQESLRFNIR